ncbi:MAG: hypothetical protein IJ479_04435 [Alphaproteobacteria bacterium]|nr:hypothetical protein [Alphaproteobacteria bacterium]
MNIYNIANIWCEFVVNEGIMPQEISRQLKDTDCDKDYRRIAKILYYNKNYSAGAQDYATLFKDEKVLDWLTKWTKRDTSKNKEFNNYSIKNINGLIESLGNMTCHGSSIVNEALAAIMVCFIQLCPDNIVAPEIRKEYLKRLETEMNRKDLAAAPVNSKKDISSLRSARQNDKPAAERKKAYKEFLRQIGHTPNVANSYASGINTTVNEYAGANLWEISDVEQIDKIMEELKSNSAYQEANDSKNGSPAAALVKYREYCEYLEQELAYS